MLLLCEVQQNSGTTSAYGMVVKQLFIINSDFQIRIKACDVLDLFTYLIWMALYVSGHNKGNQSAQPIPVRN